MRIDTITDLAALVALTPEWELLYERAPDASPFQHPAWLLPWWECFGSGKLRTYAIRNHERLVALAPMFEHPWRGLRQITLLGTGVSDRLGFLAEPEYARRTVQCVLEDLTKTMGTWDVCDWQDLPKNSALCDPASQELVQIITAQQVCSWIFLPSSGEALMESLPQGLRRNIRRYGAKLAAREAVEYRSAATQDEFQSALEQFLDLHGARWESRGEPGAFSGDNKGFYHEAAIRMWRAGKARCFTLRAGGKPIAAIYGFLDKRRFWSYQSGFDPAWAEFSPGALILEFAISEAIREGAQVFDFLRGEETYKLAWGARFERSYRVLLRGGQRASYPRAS